MPNSSNSSQSSFLITCPPGLEKFVANEINQLQLTLDEMGKGVVYCSGTVKAIYKFCLYTRFANRVLYQINEFFFQSLDELYEKSRAVSWDEWFKLDKTFAIQVNASHITLDEVKDPRIMALKVKDAIADFFMDRFRRRPTVKTKQPDFPIHLFVNKNKATLSLDMSGDSLHQRGYRVAQGDAPIKENLAAALYQMGAEDEAGAPIKIIDPMCGSGTLLIESAYALKNIAPGLDREYYGFNGWIAHRPKLWQDLVEEAQQHKDKMLAEKTWPKIIGYDADKDALQAAKRNIASAGLKGIVHTERKELQQLYREFGRNSKSDETGMLLVNPPYGERIEEIGNAEYLYHFLGKLIRHRLPGWKVVCISNRIEFLDHLKLAEQQQIQLYNGPIKCVARAMLSKTQDQEELVSGKTATLINPTDKNVEGAEDFCNRLRKNWKGLKKWVVKDSISCYRLYDADIPGFNLALDIYPDACHVQEYAPPKSIDPKKAAERLNLAIEGIVKVLDMPKKKINVKVRTKQKGNAQYNKVSSNKAFSRVAEGDGEFLVNLSDYLDTGIFLDHRPIRRRIAEESQGKRMLNLFAYTATASVHAAVGGAKQTVSVDLSTTYCDWARANLALNGLASSNHQVIRSDVLKWLERTTHQFDLIFMDPPTFSNSKKLQGHFDVQKDHPKFIDLAMRRLEPGGVLYFSNNFRKFKLDEDALAKFDVEEISQDTIPQDFARRQNIHRCWRITRRERQIYRHR